MGIANCSGEFIFFLDDDAMLLDNDALEQVSREFEHDPRLAVLYCKILNAEGQITPWIFQGAVEMYGDKELVAYSFIGAAHCIRQSLFDELGYMDASYFREGEEIDFSLRAYGAGYYVLYYPHVTVLHRESQITRNPSGQSRGYLFRNRILNYWKHLPISHSMAFTLWNVLIWMIRLLKMGYFRWYLWALLQLPILIPLTLLRKRRPVPKEHLGLWYKAYSEVVERNQLNTPQAQSGSLLGYVRSYLRKMSPRKLVATNK
jgi:GT2 family glycosyltransferase